MKLLATLKPEDVESTVPKFDYNTFTPRAAGRAIVFDQERVALIHVTKHDYYMLPGGGIENENIHAGLIREICEELGCEITITAEVGKIEVYFDRWKKKQTDFCFIANKLNSMSISTPTEFEINEGHEIIWIDTISKAIELIEKSQPLHRDGKLVRARDLLFLKSAHSYLQPSETTTP